MLRIAIIGCGKIADAHAAAILANGDCRIVGVCDHEMLMALQFRERFPADGAYEDVGDLLEKARPDVVHITTPPQSHFEVAKECLNRGCHVYVEKPFTLRTSEAVELIGLADAAGLKLTAGHDDQFSPVARRMRAVVRSGYLGRYVVHMESYYGYEMSGAYANALLGDKQHWVRNLPGQLLQNIISHGIARIAEYLQSDSPEVVAHGFTGPVLRALGEVHLVDELRVIISENDQTTAYFTFSSSIHPSLHQFRIFGDKNGLILDQDNQTLIRLKGKRNLSYAEIFIPPLNFSRQYSANFRYNARLFLARDLHMKAGMMWLIGAFYKAIIKGQPPPIPYREIILTSQIMDDIFFQLRNREKA